LKVVAIIQARMGSTRLPGKVLEDLEGETVLARVVNRLRRARLINEVLVATTDRAADDVIVKECRSLPVLVSRGDENDVLDRYFRAAQLAKAEVVVRVTSDCPLIDPEITDTTTRAGWIQKSCRLQLWGGPGRERESVTSGSMLRRTFTSIRQNLSSCL
jgi:spore coat polysaccharide biosynthesis protein SpsF (cytidylyltransferase family)